MNPKHRFPRRARGLGHLVSGGAVAALLLAGCGTDLITMDLAAFKAGGSTSLNAVSTMPVDALAYTDAEAFLSLANGGTCPTVTNSSAGAGTYTDPVTVTLDFGTGGCTDTSGFYGGATMQGSVTVTVSGPVVNGTSTGTPVNLLTTAGSVDVAFTDLVVGTGTFNGGFTIATDGASGVSLTATSFSLFDGVDTHTLSNLSLTATSFDPPTMTLSSLDGSFRYDNSSLGYVTASLNALAVDGSCGTGPSAGTIGLDAGVPQATATWTPPSCTAAVTIF